MNRKTNIFYNNSEDSKFLTFNNYTEALTGDILATDYKLWPSRFICIYLKDLDKQNYETIESAEEAKNDFILKLQQYYENKLATLRDNVDDVSPLKPLNYLITFIYWWAYNKNIINEQDKLSPIEIETKLLNDQLENNTELSDLVEFNYISDIVEQQYNGTYADIICTINPNKWEKPSLKFVTLDINEDHYDVDSYLNENNMVVNITNTTFLHGWEDENENTINKLDDWIKNPIIDLVLENGSESENVYYIKSLIDKLNINTVTSETNLKFNLIIPLFNVSNIKNANDISNDEENITSILLTNKVNIPLGIYFTDDVINLNINGKFSTNWSLLISTQFSAFPFSFDIQQKFDDSQSTKQAYLTFAEILANQTNFTDALVKYDSLIKSLQKRIELIESKLNNISTVQNIDSIVQNVNNIQNSIDELTLNINNKLEELENKIEANKLKWQVNAKNNTH